jgi:hypothetical protein
MLKTLASACAFAESGADFRLSDGVCSPSARRRGLARCSRAGVGVDSQTEEIEVGPDRPVALT